MLFPYPIPEEDLQLSVDQIPVLTASSPLFRNVHCGKIEHFQKTIVRREDRLGFGHFSKLPVEVFNGVGGIDGPPYLERIGEEGGEDIPVILPALNTGWILLAPGLFEFHQMGKRLVLGRRAIYTFQIGHKRLDVFPAYEPAAGPDLVDDAALNLRFGESRSDSFAEACQTIHTKQVHCLDATAFQFVQHGQPELRAFVLPDPNAQYLLVPLQVDPQHHIRRFGDDVPILPNLVVHRVHEYKRVGFIQRSGQPLHDLRYDPLTDFAYQFWRYLHAVQAFDLFGDILLAHPNPVQRKDLFFHPIRIPAVFAYDLRLKLSVSVSWYAYIYLP